VNTSVTPALSVLTHWAPTSVTANLATLAMASHAEVRIEFLTLCYGRDVG
jgi:hypothetical protein